MTGIIIAIVALSLAAALVVIWYLLHTERRLTRLEEWKVKIEQERQAVLDQAGLRGKTHHQYNVAAGLENAMSLLIAAVMDSQAEQARIETALGTLKAIRENPKSYNPDVKHG